MNSGRIKAVLLTITTYIIIYVLATVPPYFDFSKFHTGCFFDSLRALALVSNLLVHTSFAILIVLLMSSECTC